jgi:hypothetical protein
LVSSFFSNPFSKMSDYESSDSEFESIPINKSDPLASLKKLVETRLKNARRVKNITVSSQKKRTFDSESEEDGEEQEEKVVRNQHFALVSLDAESESTDPTAALLFKENSFKRTKRQDVLGAMMGKRVRNGTMDPVPLKFCRSGKKGRVGKKARK